MEKKDLFYTFKRCICLTPGRRRFLMSYSQFNKIYFRLHLNIFLVTSTRDLWLHLSNVFKVAYTKRLFDGIYCLPFSLHLLNIFKVPSIKHILDSIRGKSKIHPLSYIKTILLVRHLREYMHFLNKLVFFTVWIPGACFYYVCKSRKSSCESVFFVYLLIIPPYILILWLFFTLTCCNLLVLWKG